MVLCRRFVVLAAAVVAVSAGGVSAQTLTRPVAVPFSSGPGFPLDRESGSPADPQYSADRAIDGDPATFACILDDTLKGTSKKSIPALGATPVTGHMIFDLGRPMLVGGVRLTGRKDAGPLGPKQVDFFYFADDNPADNRLVDDIEGDVDIQTLVKKHACKGLSRGDSESIHWRGLIARYVGLRVNDSFESGPVHFNFQLGEVAFFTSPRPPELPPGSRIPPVYTKQKTLQETMRASHKNYAAWFPDPSPVGDPAARFWEQLRRDFPPSNNRLLDFMLFDWFEAAGWLGSSNNTKLERRLIERALGQADSLGSAVGSSLRKEYESLAKSNAPPNDPRWLDLCVKASEFALIAVEAAKLRPAVGELGRSFPGRYPADELLGRLDQFNKKLIAKTERPWTSHDKETEQLVEELRKLKHDALVRLNPLLAGKKLLLAKRFTYSPGWYYAEFMRASRFGGNLYVLSVDDGKLTRLVPELEGGIFDRYDLSFDGRRVVFGYKSAPGHGFRIHEVGIDGRGLRQLTFDPADEQERIDKYWHPRFKKSGVYRHHTDDFHPCYLPDGRICFTSTRCERGVLCGQDDSLSVNVLYRIDGDGRNMRMLSEGALSESTPSVMNDGRILYTRWEYVDKGVIAVQSLWSMRPDGTGTFEVYGNYIEDPPVFIHGRAIPGRNNLFVSTCVMHHPGAIGPIVRLDINQDIRTHKPIRYLTPDTRLSVEGVGGYPRGERFMHKKNGRWVADNIGPLFSDPYPLSDKFFLVACNPNRPWNHATAYGIYLLDEYGNRVLVYDDPAISCWQPIPLEPRARPPVVPSIAETLVGEESSPAEAAAEAAAEATVLMTDVYQGLDGVERGTVKYLRVLEQVARPWSARRFWPHDETLGQHAVVSLYAHIYVKVHHGVVPVEEDGSAHFKVPADKNIFFQALDENFMEVQRMRTFVNFQPGESRSCIGCHEPRSLAPPSKMPLALSHPPRRPGPQPGETVPRPIHYPTDVQPILDRHCVRCHGGEKTEGELDLSGELTTFFNRSYENLMRKKLLSYIQEFVGPQPRAQKTNVVPLSARALGSHASRLIAVLVEGHYEVKLTPAEMVRLITWVDANGPYYGSYFGRRNLMYKDLPDFRPLPTLRTASGLPPTALNATGR